MAIPWALLAITAVTLIAEAVGSSIQQSVNDALKNGRDSGKISNAQYQEQVNPEGYKQGLQAYREWRENEEEAEKEYGERRVEIVKDYAKQVADSEATYAKQRARLIQDYADQQKQAVEDFENTRTRQYRDFYQSQSQAETDYYAERKQMAADYNRDIQRMEEDHQREMTRSKEDHDVRMQELLESGDVKGMQKELRSYERNRRRGEEDYGVENEDYSGQIADREAQFAQQRAQSMREFQQRMNDEAVDFVNRQKQSADQFQDRLKQLDEQHAEELKKLDQANKEKLTDMDKQFQDERIKRRNAYTKQLEDLGIYLQRSAAFWKSFLQNVQDQLNYNAQLNGTPGRASGGYAGFGTYRLGEQGTEYVLDARTTRAAEVAAGGRLTQTRMLNALAGRGGNVTWNDHRRFDSRLSVADRRAIQQDNMATMASMFGGM
jgi:hypothetical protein